VSGRTTVVFGLQLYSSQNTRIHAGLCLFPSSMGICVHSYPTHP
jgi:hypothetical protein